MCQKKFSSGVPVAARSWSSTGWPGRSLAAISLASTPTSVSVGRRPMRISGSEGPTTSLPLSACHSKAISDSMAVRASRRLTLRAVIRRRVSSAYGRQAAAPSASSIFRPVLA